jgi:cold shock CspA family protein
MMNMLPAARRTVALAGLIVVSGACAPLDTVFGDVGTPYGQSINGEVRSLDARRGRLQVREDYGNRTHTIRYDNRTRVTYNQRQYSPSSLERGDQVRVVVTRDRSGETWADRIDVRRSARDARLSSRVLRIDGVVRAVDTRRGYFTLERSRNNTITVHVSQRLNSSDARRFERLRRGERVRVEVRQHLNNSRAAELVRFR